MPRHRIPMRLVRQISVERWPRGLRAVYLVEADSDEDKRALLQVFKQFEPVLENIQLSSGKLVSYAVQLQSEDQSILEELEGLLKRDFGFVILHRSFDPLIYEIVSELCKDSGSRLIAVPKCDICRRPEPFPDTVVNFADEENNRIATRAYCGSCAAQSVGRNSKEFVTSLLEADRADFRALRHMTLVRSRSAKKQLAFRVKLDAERQFATR